MVFIAATPSAPPLMAASALSSMCVTLGVSFAMKGRESDLASLDMEKAVSDMQKDQALMQYQYFVGDTNIANSEDGIVIQK